jgi:hypothetical protein
MRFSDTKKTPLNEAFFYGLNVIKTSDQPV